MHHRPCNNPLGRRYWRAVRRYPALYALVCFFGLSVGMGALCFFGEPEPDTVKRAFLQALGAPMLLFYGWLLVAFSAKIRRGLWSSHCDGRILFFSGEPKA